MLLRRRSMMATFPRAAYDDLIYQRRQFGWLSVFVNDPDAVRHVFVANAANYERPVLARRLLRPLSGDGLLLAEDAAWRRQRRILAPAFTPEHVSLALPHFAAAGEALVGELSSGRVNLLARVRDTALDAACRALFSLPSDQDGTYRRLSALVREYFVHAGWISLWDMLARRENDYGWAQRERSDFKRRWFAEIDGIVADRRRHPPAGGARDLLDLLMDARTPDGAPALSDKEISDQVATMMAAGFETTHAMFWTIYLLACDRSVQDEVRAEVLATPAGSVRMLAGLRAWPALRRVLLEALRLYPPFPVTARVAKQDDVVGGVAIRAGTLVMLSPWIIHRHRRFWDQPDAFIPARWIGREDHPGEHYIPFGVGPRICIGAAFATSQVMLVVAALIARYRVELDDARPVLPTLRNATVPAIEPWFRLETLDQARDTGPMKIRRRWPLRA
jgi:cytochrome P450